jgi:sortase A
MRPVSLSLARPRLLRVRAVLRFVASVMMVSGTLLIADAAVTLLWQEPVSAYVAGKNQGTLKKAFFDPPRRVIRREPLKGDAIARIRIPSIGLSKYVVEGTDVDSLRKGPGHYPDTPLPGEAGTAAIAGHRTTYGAPFRHIDEVQHGEPITIDMPDGRFVYRIERTKIVDDQDLSVLDRVGYQRLVLSACHPLYSAAQRIIVFARLVKREPARVKRG